MFGQLHDLHAYNICACLHILKKNCLLTLLPKKIGKYAVAVSWKALKNILKEKRVGTFGEFFNLGLQYQCLEI